MNKKSANKDHNIFNHLNLRYAFFLLSLLSVLTFCLCGCGRQEKVPYTKTDFYFDTVVSLTIYDTPDNQTKVETLLDETMAECARYDDLLNAYKEGSEIWQINNAAGEWVFVSDETKNMIYEALKFCDMTNGGIDITIKPVKDLWDFDPDGSHAIPLDTFLSKAISHVNYRLIETEGNKIRLGDPEAQIDPGFIAKGFIADELKAFLLTKNVDCAIINLGGNVQTIGAKPDGSLFSVGIQKPWADNGVYSKIVELGDFARNSDSKSMKEPQTAVATSGVYERYFQKGDTIYHHILNPLNGMPVQTDLDSVTIIAHSATDADALSTTCLILGSEKAESYIRSLENIDAILIKQDGTIIDTKEP